MILRPMASRTTYPVGAVDSVRVGGAKRLLACVLGTAAVIASWASSFCQEAEGTTPAAVRWETQVIDSEGDTGWYTCLVLDPETGLPLMSYYNHTEGELRLARWDGSGWEIETVDSRGQVGWYSSLVMDPKNGRPRIAYHDITNRDLKYA